MNTKATIDKTNINSYPQRMAELGRERFFLYLKKDKDIDNLADYLMSKYGVLPTYRADYKKEMNHYIALDKALRRYKGDGASFWTYLNLVMSCNVLDYARRRANDYKKYLLAEDVRSDDSYDECDLEADLDRKQTEEELWRILNSKLGGTDSEILKLKAAGYNDRDIRKRIKVKQADIDQAKMKLMTEYEVEL